MKLKSGAGFTLIELLVSIAVMATLSGIVIANYRANEKTAQLNAAKDMVINVLRNAQLYALSGKKIDASTCAPGGVSNKSAKSFLVKNINQTSTFELFGVDQCNVSLLIETFTLPSKTRVNNPSIRVNDVITDDDWQIKFTTPFAVNSYSLSTTTNGGTFNSFITAVISLELTDASRQTTVTVDGVSGRIGEGTTSSSGGGDASP